MSLLESALLYYDLGWSVIPIRRSADPKIDKTPYIKWEKYQTERANKLEITKWFKKWPDANIAVITGKISGVTVVDFDSLDSLEKIEATICDLPETIIQETGREGGGRHYFFSYTDKLYTVAKAAKNKIKDIDIRNDGGYIIINPSVHGITGNKYKWGKISPLEDGLDDICEVPEELVDFILKSLSGSDNKTKDSKSKDTQQKNPDGWLDEIIWGVGEGERNHVTAKYAGWLLRKNDGNEAITLDALLTWNQRNKPPLDEKEIKVILSSIAKKHSKNKSAVNNVSLVIEKFRILEYPDGQTECELKVSGVEKTVRMNIEDLDGSIIFRRKLLKMTRKLFVMPSSKQGKWAEFVNHLLDEAEIHEVSEEETHIPTLREIIQSDLKRGGSEPDDAGEDINRMCIVYENNLHFKLSTIIRHLQFSELRQLGRKNIINLLRQIGFEYTDKPLRIDGKLHKTWQMHLSKWREF